MNSLSMMALLYLPFLLLNMVVMGAQADSATGENKTKESSLWFEPFLGAFSLMPVVMDKRKAKSQDHPVGFEGCP